MEALIPKRVFNHPGICWRSNTAGHKQSWKFLESISDYFLTQAIEEAMKGGALLEVLMLTNKEGLTHW